MRICVGSVARFIAWLVQACATLLFVAAPALAYDLSDSAIPDASAANAPASGTGIPELPVSVSVSMPRSHDRAPVPRVGRHEARGVQTVAVPAELITAVAQRYRIDAHLLAAIVRTESGGNRLAISRKGALGLMQVMPATARAMGVTNPGALLADPELALEVGAAYLKMLQARLGNNVPLVLAAYNAGPGAVVRAGMRVPRYSETQAYVGRVMSGYVAARATALR